MKTIYQYPITDTLNNKVNALTLHLEIKASTVYNYEECKVIGNKDIQLFFSTGIDDAHKTILDTIVSDHTGEVALVDEVYVEERESKIRELTEMAILHPSLPPLETEEYLVEIDNYLNAWKRSGRNSVLISKLMADALDTNHPRYTYLNTVVNEAGNKTFEYFISIVS
jgi:hypothetical protein